MSLKHHHFLVVLGALVCGACAGASRAPADDPSGEPVRGGELPTVRIRHDAVVVARDYSVSVDQLWAVLPGAFADLGYQGAPAKDRLYLTPSLTVRGRLDPKVPNATFLNCGRTTAGGQAANEYEVTFTVLARARARAAGTSRLEVIVDGWASDRASRSGGNFCSGTGQIEESIFQAAERRLAANR